MGNKTEELMATKQMSKHRQEHVDCTAVSEVQNFQLLAI